MRIRTRRASRGTTLLELLLVLAVLGVATSVVAFSAPQRRASDSIVQERRALRSTAVTFGRDTSVVLTVRGRTLLVTARRTGSVREDTVGAARTTRGATRDR